MKETIIWIVWLGFVFVFAGVPVMIVKMIEADDIEGWLTATINSLSQCEDAWMILNEFSYLQLYMSVGLQKKIYALNIVRIIRTDFLH